MNKPQFGKANSNGGMQTIEQTCYELYYYLCNESNMTRVIKQNKMVEQTEEVLHALITPTLGPTGEQSSERFENTESEVRWTNTQRHIAIVMVGAIQDNKFADTVAVSTNEELRSLIQKGDINGIKWLLKKIYKNMNFMSLSDVVLIKQIQELRIYTNVLEYKNKLYKLINDYNEVAKNELKDDRIWEIIMQNSLINSEDDSLARHLHSVYIYREFEKTTNTTELFEKMIEEEHAYVRSNLMKKRKVVDKENKTLLMTSKKQKNDAKGTKTFTVRSFDSHVCPICYIVKQKFVKHGDSGEEGCRLDKYQKIPALKINVLKGKSQSELDRIIEENKDVVEETRREHETSVKAWNEKNPQVGKKK